MPVDNNSENSSLFIKLLGYVGGVLLGLAVKIAILHKEKPLTLREFITHSLIAFACAYLCWSVMTHYGIVEWANIVSVIVGRYGDLILIMIWKQVQDAIKNFKG